MNSKDVRSNDILVVKVGTTTLFKHADGKEILDIDSLKRISDQIKRFIEHYGHNVVIVSSGAVTAGMEAVNTNVRPTGNESMPEVQRLATIGWHRVLSAWEKSLNGYVVGGILVTKRELDLSAPEHDEVLQTTHTLFQHKNIPILNENDAITHSELSYQSFGQNDTLAAIYAAQVATSKIFSGKVRLILLSDVDGVLSNMKDPGSVIREIDNLNSYRNLAGQSSSSHGKGGMSTKFEAAEIAINAGVDMWITNGRLDNAIELALNGESGTHFKSR